MPTLITNSPRVLSKFLHTFKMPAFTLYSSRGSTNTDRVRLTLAEGGFTDFELVMLDLAKGEQKVSKMCLQALARLERHNSPSRKKRKANSYAEPRVH
jgi:hypothetical protein